MRARKFLFVVAVWTCGACGIWGGLSVTDEQDHGQAAFHLKSGNPGCYRDKRTSPGAGGDLCVEQAEDGRYVRKGLRRAKRDLLTRF